MNAQLILRENIKALLRARKEDASVLASWLGHDKSWINKILNAHRTMQIEDFDRVADFFGLVTYQLFQPGISRFTERRLTKDRRLGRDRRIGHAQRVMLEVAGELDRVRPPATGKGRHAAATVLDPVQRVLDQAIEGLQRLNRQMEDARGQAAVARPSKARVRARDRAVGESDDPGAAKQVKPSKG